MTSIQSVYPRWLRQCVALQGSVRLGGGDPEPVRWIDLSVRGAFCETPRTAPPGEPAHAVLELPDGALTVQAVVTRSGTALRDAPHPELDQRRIRVAGMGLRFVSLPADVQRRLEQFLSALGEA